MVLTFPQRGCIIPTVSGAQKMGNQYGNITRAFSGSTWWPCRRVAHGKSDATVSHGLLHSKIWHFSENLDQV